MARERWYPPANKTAQRFDDNYPGLLFTHPLKRVVWHSTETGGWPGYGGGASAPTLTARPNFSTRRIEWRQHFPIDMSARALRNESGGVETNRDECVQVEIVGTCDPERHESSPSWLYTPAAPDWFLDDLAVFSAWLFEVWGVPLKSAPSWKPYPSSYGVTNANRFTDSEWRAFRGHCGHQHVPENTHGDPGKMTMNVVMATAADIVNPPAPPAPAPPPQNTVRSWGMFVTKYGTQHYVVDAAGKRAIDGPVATELINAGVPAVPNMSATTLNEFPTLDGLYERIEQAAAAGRAQTDTLEGSAAGDAASLAALQQSVADLHAKVDALAGGAQ